MKKVTITEASKIVQIDRDKIRYGSKLLGIKLIKQGRVSYIPASAISLLKAMYKSVASGLSPALAAKEVLELHATIPEPPQDTISKEISNNVLTNRMETLEQAVMLLVESNKKLSEENKGQKELLNKLCNILIPPTSHKQIEVWKPSKTKHPKYSALQRIWYEITNPEKLRAN